MDSGRRQVVVFAIIGFLIGSSLIIGAALTGTVPIDNGVPLVSPDGMAVTVDGSTNANLEDPFTLGGTVNVRTTDGNATFYSAGAAEATIHKDDIEGTYTTVTAIDAGSNSIQIDPDDKQQVTVAQEITQIEWTDTNAADDAARDFSYEASGPGEVTLNNAPASTTLYAVNGAGYILDQGTSDSGGTVTFDELDSGDHDVYLQTGLNKDPILENASPQGDLTSEPTEFSVDVSDPNLGNGDAVTVVINYEGTQQHSETITSNQTVTTSVPTEATQGGAHSWSVETDDDFGGSTDASYSYNVPSQLTFREETPPHNAIQGATDPITVEATFFEDIEDDPVIINRTTTDGTINLDGLPVSSEFAVSVTAPGYHTRTVRLEDIYTQNDIYLIEKNAETTVENRFVVNDRTGDFPPEETTISIEAPVNESLFDANANGFSWVTVSGDDLGADEAFVDDLVEEKRYRIIVENGQGDQRNLGSYTPETTGTIELNIGSIEVAPEEPDSVASSAQWLNESNDPTVRVEYNDTAMATETLYVNIYEYGNESNVLVDNQSFSGPFGTFSHVEDVPVAENDTTWVVEVRGDRVENADGEAVSNVLFKDYVGPNVSVLTGLPPWLVTIIFVGMMWAVAGLFSQVNGHVGGLVVAGLGGMFWFVGLVPSYLGGGVVVLALLTAGILFIRGARGEI
ncbi:MAG: hypothetical protein RI568_13810 [Natronomonas sp.]|uniref:hypothetical protein n=1 Tax=Natronomonas sp. TaxID=2184060 RepID=UPI00286FD07F|nr:hypothetical protein [Natronomonas sp.]MDR9431758.1 hypothetical protein [Natronomonas sp.]